MDKRLVLDENQKKVVNEYLEVCQKIRNAGIKVIYRVDDLFFINGKKVKDINFVGYTEPEDNEEAIEVEFDELIGYPYPYDFAVGVVDEESFEVII